MTAIDVAALIGAAAWLPQIASWVYKLFVHPKVQFVPAPSPELGYTTFGPIFNVQCALACSRKDAIVERIRISLRHERGRTIDLNWVQLNETFSQIRSAGGETADVSKSQPAIALKVGTLGLVEKTIGFQDLRFNKEARTLLLVVVEHSNHLRKTRPEDFIEETLRSKQYADLIDFLRRSMCWEVGHYRMAVQLHVLDVKQPQVRHWRFSLSASDVERLTQNVEEGTRYIREVFAPPPPETRKEFLWNWINPALEPEPDRQAAAPNRVNQA